MKKLFRVLIGLMLLVGFFLLATNVWVIASTSDSMYTVDECPEKGVALVLGTSKKTSSGSPNRFFEERMITAARLYELGKVKHLIVSGDNRTRYYNEPRDMLNALENLDVPDSAITRDFAGLRTFDSVVRCKYIFKQEKVAIVTQEFHCYRSLFIAEYFGIDAVGVTADEGEFIGIQLAVREIFARTMAVLDLYVLQSEPKFLGEELPINITN